MRLYHSPGSRSARVLWTLEEIGAPYEITVLSTDERRTTEHRSRNPLGRVPVLELDDGRLLLESAAICLYLADLYPGSGVAPALDAPERPFLYQWLFFAMTELEPNAGAWSRARREGEDETQHAERFGELSAVVSNQLRDQTWILGQTFTIADIVAARILNIYFNRELVDGPDDLRAYTTRALERPAWIRADAIGRT